jgi:hypothetical protein
MVDFPYAPEDVAVEMRLGGTWVDLAAAGKIKLADGIQIQRGKTGATSGFSQPSAGSCQFTIKNSDGTYSPDNPLSPYYRDLGRGTPVRVACRVAEDAFTRTTASSLGTADRGGAWTTNGSAANFATNGSTAQITMSSANATNYAYQAASVYASHDVAFTFTFPMSNVTGGTVSAAAVLGWVSASDYFVARLTISATEVMTMDVEHRTDGVSIASAVTVSDFAYTGQAIRIRAQLAGETIRARVWPAASVEPLTWHMEQDYAFDAYLDRAKGAAGFRINTGVGNTNVPFTVTVDDWEVRSNRYAGSVSSLSVETDVTGKEVNTRVEVGGPRRRLGTSNVPSLSPLTRAHTFYDDTANGHPPHLLYYPFEDASGSSQVASGLPNGTAMTLASGTPVFASSSDFPGSLSIAKAASNVRWFSPRTGNTSSTGEAQLLFCLSVPSTGDFDTGTLAQIQLSGTLGFVDIVYGTASSGRIYLVFYDQNRVNIATSASLVTGINGVPSMMSVELTQSGADINYQVTQLPVGSAFAPLGGATLAGRTIGRVNGFFMPPYGQITATAIGQAALRNDIAPLTDFLLQLNGYSFPDVPTNEVFVETSFFRTQRLAEQENIPFTFIRRPNIGSVDIYLGDWTDLGEQGTSSALSLMDEATNADLGTLFEDRDIEGLVFRNGRSKYNQDAVLTIDIASGQLAPPFKMPKDDQLLLNDVELKRTSGSSVRVSDAALVTSQGEHKGSFTLNLWSDTQLTDRAYWMLHLGTSEDPRFPSMKLDLARAARDSRQLYLDMLALDIDDRVVATNPSDYVIGADLDLIAIGFNEVLAGKSHTITAACTPGGPWAVAEAATDSGDTNPWLGRLDTDDSEVAAAAAAGATSLKVAVMSGPAWTATADDYPLYLDVGGLQVRATAITSENVTNTGFETNLTGWTASGLTSFTQSATQKHSGSFAARLVPTGAASSCGIIGNLVSVRPGEPVTCSAWAWFTSAVTTNYSAAINWYDASQVYISTSFTMRSASATTWTQDSGTYTAPATAAFAAAVPLLGGTPAAAQVWYADDVSLTGPQTFTVDALPAARAAGLSVSVWHLPVLGY